MLMIVHVFMFHYLFIFYIFYKRILRKSLEEKKIWNKNRVKEVLYKSRALE